MDEIQKCKAWELWEEANRVVANNEGDIVAASIIVAAVYLGDIANRIGSVLENK